MITTHRSIFKLQKPWYSPLDETNYDAIDQLKVKITNNFLLAHPSNNSKGKGVCFLCLKVMSVANGTYLIEHVTLYCPGAKYDIRMQFLSKVKGSKGRSRPGRERLIEELEGNTKVQ